jgi:hypothetical protein
MEPALPTARSGRGGLQKNGSSDNNLRHFEIIFAVLSILAPLVRRNSKRRKSSRLKYRSAADSKPDKKEKQQCDSS